MCSIDIEEGDILAIGDDSGITLEALQEGAQQGRYYSYEKHGWASMSLMEWLARKLLCFIIDSVKKNASIAHGKP